MKIGSRTSRRTEWTDGSGAQHFDFLGYQFGRFYTKTGKAYWGTRPSKKSVKRLIQSIHEQTAHRMSLLEAEDLVDNLNRKLRGWGAPQCNGEITD